MPTQRDFAAFISYSHADEAFAAKLHRKLESWRTPRRLVNAEGRDGPVPARLFPVFRDREELPTSDDLGATLRGALERSRYLIVLCSPRSAQSIWVNEEVLQFKQMHGESRIIAVIIEGEPPDCFPPALRYRMGADGTLTTAESEPIAADFRSGKDGWSRGLMKVLAGVLGVNLDDLVMRDRTRRRRRIQLAAAASVAVLGSTAIGVTQWLERERVRLAEEDVVKGASALRTGDPFRGSYHFLDGVARLGEAAPVAVRDLAEELSKRLVPFDEAFAALEPGEVVTWRADTYIRHGGRLTPFANAERQARTDTHVITSDVSGGLTARSMSDLSMTAQFEMDTREEICGIWSDGRQDVVYVEGAYYGSYVGANYGFGGWFDLTTGAYERGTGQLETRFCRPDGAPPVGLTDLTRLDSDVTAFKWPALRPESEFWELAPLDPRMPLLYDEGKEAFVADMWINFPERMKEKSTEQGLMMDLLDAKMSHRVLRARTCPDGGLVAGVWDYGANSGSLYACRLDQNSEATCAFLPMVGDVLSTRFSPDCSMTTFAASLIGDGGLAIVDNASTADELTTLKVEGIETLRQARLPAFSPDSRLFAVSDDARRVLVYEKTTKGLEQRAVHESPADIVLMSFMGNDRIATVGADGRLRAMDALTGAPLWPAIPIEERVREAIDPALTYGQRERGRLVADQGGTRLALMVVLPRSAMPERFGAGESEESATSIVQFFDGGLGVPLGGPLHTGWATGPVFIQDAWDLAALYDSAQGGGPRSLMFPPWAAYREVPGPAADPDPDLERLTGYARDGALQILPEPKQ